jgi:hypothetical protein
MSELVGYGGNDVTGFSRFSKLSRTEKVAAQDGLLVDAVLLEMFGYCIRNDGFA